MSVIVIEVNELRFGLGPAKRISRVEIVNRGDHPRRPDYGNYDITFFDANRKPIKTCDVRDHLRSEGFWPLFQRALKAFSEG